MDLKNLLNSINTYRIEIILVVAALFIVYGLAILVDCNNCADGTPLTDFQVIQTCTYLMIVLLGIFTMTNAARSRATTNEIKDMMLMREKGKPETQDEGGL